MRLTVGSRFVRLRAFGLAAIFLCTASGASQAAVLLFEDFETPAISIQGATSPNLPTGWQSNGIGIPEIWRPGLFAVPFRWNQAEPMASPAGGNQILFLNQWEGIYKQVGTIAPNTTYTLSAAIGYDKWIGNPLNWSLQMYADSNDNGSLDPDDTFLVQEFGGSGNAVNPLPGDWVTNSTSFDSAQIDPSLLGKTLLVLLFNYNDSIASTSNYDNVLLTAVPELSTIQLVLASALALGLWKLARRRTA
jgi:hypothetical protein